MSAPPAQRIIVMGPPGSGKSTLARTLGARHGLPVFHLDQAYWRPGWVEAAAGVFRAEVERIAALPAWVIDGNFADTLAPRMRRADAIYYLDVANWWCLGRIIRRTLRSYGQTRADGPAGCRERLDFEFLRFAWQWNRIRRQRTLDLIATFAGPVTIVTPGSGLEAGGADCGRNGGAANGGGEGGG